MVESTHRSRATEEIPMFSAENIDNSEEPTRNQDASIQADLNMFDNYFSSAFIS